MLIVTQTPSSAPLSSDPMVKERYAKLLLMDVEDVPAVLKLEISLIL